MAGCAGLVADWRPASSGPIATNDTAWLENTFIPTVQLRGAALIGARGLASAARAANAAIDHVRVWAGGTKDGDWLTMGVASVGSAASPEGVIYGYPCTTENGAFTRLPHRS